MLTLEQINKIRSEAGATPISSSGITQKSLVERTAGTQTPRAPSYGSLVGEEQVAGAKKIKSSIEKGAKSFATAGEQLAEGKPLSAFGTTLKGTAQSGFGTITGASQIALAPAIPAISKGIEAITPELRRENPVLAKAYDYVAPKMADLSAKHPEASELTNDIINTLLLAVGGPKIKPVLKASGEVATDITKGAISKVEQKIAETTEGQSLKAIKATEDTMSKADRLQAIEEGRQQITKLGKKEYIPTETEKRASNLLKGKVTNNPVKDFKVIKDEIATRGKEAEQYLKDNAKPITNKDHYDAFQVKRTEAEKYLTESELKAYDEQVKMFSKQLPGRGSYDTDTYYKALKDYESNIADKLPRGKEALLDPTGVANAKIRAAADVRKVVRDMIGTKNPEFKEKMFDLASLYDVKDTVATKAEKLPGTAVSRFVKKHPTLTKVGGGLLLGEVGRKIITDSF